MDEQVPVREAGVFFPGDIIERKYRIVKLLAEGGMGSVYHAVQEPLGRDVALKVLKPGNDSAEQRAARLKRFFREASVSSRLSHPNTVMIFDYGELANDEGFFLVMEFLHGRVLRDLMPAGTYMQTSLALHVAIQIAGSLAEAHAAGVVHRDLKPPNVMIVDRGGDPYFVKVVDFGLVKDLEDDNNDELTAENTLLGSPTYMAPERFLSKNADSPSVDIYALGILLYEMLVGRPPFQRDGEATVHRLIMQHIQAEPPPLRTFRPDIVLPEGLEALIMRCLAKNPEDRIGSMETLLRMLKAIASTLDGFSNSGSLEFIAPPVDLPPNLLQPLNDTGPGLSPHTQETVHTLPLPPGTATASMPSSATAPAATHDTASEAVLQQNQAIQRKQRIMMAGIIVLTLLIVGVAASMFLSSDEQPATETVATQTSVELFAQSVPTGAIVYLKDQELGRTPLRMNLPLPVGATLRFSLEDFEDFDHHVTEISGDSLQISAQLQRRPAALDSVPADPAPPEETTPEPAPSEEPADSARDNQQAENFQAEKPAPAPAAPAKKPKKSNTAKSSPAPPADLDIRLDR